MSDEHEHDGPPTVTYLMLTSEDAGALTRARIVELEREHYKLGLRIAEGETAPHLDHDRAECQRRIRIHAEALGLVEAEPQMPAPPTDGEAESWRSVTPALDEPDIADGRTPSPDLPTSADD